MCENLHDLSEVRSCAGLQISTVGDELEEAVVKSVVGSELLSSLNLGSDLAWLKSIEGYLALDCLPQKSAKGKHINFLVVGSLLEQLWCHVARRSRILHRSRSQVSLHKNGLLVRLMMTLCLLGVLTIKRARPKSQTFTL